MPGPTVKVWKREDQSARRSADPWAVGLRGFLLAVEAHDVLMLERALSLAEKGRGCTSPNPVVGAVIVAGGRVLGEGYHAGPGRDHAEVAAIKDAIRQAGNGEGSPEFPVDAAAARATCLGATIYVTLEPCCTYGRTPPCTSALIAAGVARVVVGAVDPTPAVNGRGLQILRDAGLVVDVAGGDLERRMKRQNDGLRKVMATGLPFVTYKYAMTLDGRLATDTGDSRWISGPESRALVHRWRAWSDAVLVGAGTLQADDPRLTAREVECHRQPLRVVVGGAGSLSRESVLVQSVGEGPVLAVTGPGLEERRSAELRGWGVEVEMAAGSGEDSPDPRAVASLLGGRGVQNVLLEGGRRLAGAWWQAGMIDKVAAFVCPKVAPGVEHRGALAGAGPTLMEDAACLLEVEVRPVGSDVLITGYTGEAY
jgi:diaminohydroxyphosphoribosylaminopyrimidine deaminase / 5-amino-6-(5-phosphoribosylamino)uracil reductase